MFEDVRFEDFFDRIREFHARVRKKFYPVVLVGIVGGGNNDAGLKIILADQAGYTGSGDDARESYGGAGLLESCGEQSGDVRTGFAGVHADEHVSGGMF